MHVGPNLSPRGQGYTFAGLMKFTDKAAADAYTTHPMHLALLKWLVPLIDPVELDFEAIGLVFYLTIMLRISNILSCRKTESSRRLGKRAL